MDMNEYKLNNNINTGGTSLYGEVKLKPIELIDPTNKNYIAKDYLSYTVDKNDVFKSMMDKVKKESNVPKKLPGESFKDYKKRTNQ